MNLLSQRTHPEFHDEWESIRQDQRETLISQKLTEFIEFSRQNVPFYKERLSGFQSNATYPLKDIPVMTSDTLRDLVPPLSHDLLSQNTRDYTVFQSGGTTGFPKSTLFSHQELELLNLGNSRGFFAMGLSPQDRVGNLFAVGGLYMTFIHINRMLQQYGCMNFPFSNHTAVDFIHTATKLYGINCFAGITSVVLAALRGMAHLGLDGINIKKVFYGGEHIYEADKIELQEKFGVQVIGAPGYGTVDTWYIGYQCLASETGTFHTHDDQCYVEIFDEDENKHVSGEGIGMLYATPMVRRLTPIVRYRVGDRAQWLTTPCSCGRQTPRFKLLGRGDDVLRIGYDSVDYNFIQGVVTGFKELSGTVQMQKLRIEGRDQLVIRIETEHSTNQNLATRVADQITELRPTLRDHVKKEIVWPVKVELVNPGKIERNVRTGKLIRVKDVIKETNG